MKGILVYLIFLCAAAMLSCGTTHQLTSGTDRSLGKAWNKSGLAEDHHAGLVVYDPTANEVLFSYRADNYFTAASNIKILTLYAALQILGDSIVAANYLETPDSLFVWGGGDPGTLYPDTDTTNSFVAFLAKSDKVIVLSDVHFKAERFGRGWAWDDYPYAYQCERNAYPVYGNRIWVHRIKDSIDIKPKYLSAAFTIQKSENPTHGKTEWGDDYFYTYNDGLASENVVIPITFFENDIRYTWGEITGKNISHTAAAMPPVTKSIMGSSRDSLLKIVMQESDNFIAEQILLSCSFMKLGYMSDVDFINQFQTKYLFNLSEKPKWFDGSGLSRYNALTPTTIIDILQRIYQLKGMDYITTIFPAGGESGTIQNYLVGPKGKPYVYAKSGSLRNVYCLSGYLIAKSGKVLLFSWMNNNMQISAEALKSKIENYLLFVYDHN